MGKAGIFWPYGVKAIKCWAVEAQAGRLRIAGAVVLLIIFQGCLLPVELYRICRRRFRSPREIG